MAKAEGNAAAVSGQVGSKAEFDLHVLLIMKQDGLSKSKALLKAYIEGLGGVARRLAPPAQTT